MNVAGIRTELVRWDAQRFTSRIDEVLSVYAAAMGYSASVISARRGFVVGHTHRPDFRAVATLDTTSGALLGIGYGYRSLAGQWWREQVASGLDQAARDIWLADCFELVELHVLPAAQGAGLGEAQLRLLMDGCPTSTVLLSTPEGDTRAWRLYRRLEFVDVLRFHVFPGDTRRFGVLGRHLPLPTAST